MSSKLRISGGDGAFIHERPNAPIIERILYQDDIMLLQGAEKSGKTILANQLLFNLTTGDSFLGKYKIPKPKNVIYFQAEGKENETIDRLLRMEKTIRCDRGKYARFYKKFFPIDNDHYLNFFIEGIDSLSWKPDVLIFDALYMGMEGDLIDNQEVRKFIANFSYIVEKYSLTAILLHHESKDLRDEGGKVVERGDKGTYGSVFIRSWVDNIFNLKKRGKKTRTLSCETTRSGKNFIEQIILIGKTDGEGIDEPLYYKINEDAE